MRCTCGNELPEGAVSCKVCGRRFIKCPQCGRPLPEGAIICNACNWRITSKAKKGNQAEQVDGGISWTIPGSQKQKKSGKGKKILLIAAVGIFLVGTSLAVASQVAGNEAKMVNKASQLLAEENYAECVSYTQEALDQYADNPQLMQMLGSAQVKMGDYESASATFDQLDLEKVQAEYLPDYIQAKLHNGGSNQAMEALDRYTSEGKADSAAALAEIAQTSVQYDDTEILDRSVAELNRIMENGQSEPDWNMATASSLLNTIFQQPSQEELEITIPYYIQAAEHSDANLEPTLVSCYQAWRNTATDPLQGDWACYSLMQNASNSTDSQKKIENAYSNYLGQPEANAGEIAEMLLVQNENGSLSLGPDSEQFCDTILNVYAQQNGSDQRAKQIADAFTSKDYEQAIQIWEEDPWLESHDLWFRGGSFLLNPTGTGDDYVHVSASGVYFGQAEDGVPQGTGAMVMRGADGQILYYLGTWSSGVKNGTWISLNEQTGSTTMAAEKPSRSASQAAAPEKQSQSSSTSAQQSTTTTPAPAQQSTPAPETQPQPATSQASSMVSQQTLQEMMQEAEKQAQQLLDSVQ